MRIIKTKLKSIINYYFIEKGKGLEEFLRFTNNIKVNSEKGEIAEEKASEYLINKVIILKRSGDINKNKN
jgi:hypothetical protein